MEYVRHLLRTWATPAKESIHQFLLDTLRRCTALGLTGVLRGQVMYNELNDAEPYPQDALNSLRDLIREYDLINDSAILNDLQRSIAVTQDDAGVGIRLAREVNDAVQRIRRKDALGGRIVVLATALQMYHVDMSQRHQDWASPSVDAQTDQVVDHAIKALQGDDAGVFWAKLPSSDLQILANFLKVSPEQVPDTMRDYLGAATNSLFVEPSIQ